MTAVRFTILALSALAAACSNVPRSRDLANADVDGATLAVQVCANCHGTTGVAKSPNFPNLAAQQPAYFSAQMADFKRHSRRDPAGYEYMWGISRHLTDKQVAELAAFYAAQPAPAQRVEGAPARIEAGRAIFTGGIAANGVPPCAGCHGPEGAGNGAFPRLAGQHLDYVVKQLTVFQRTDQRPDAPLMKPVAHALSGEDVRNVAAYVQSLPGVAAAR